jgi:succinyl-diaminopimelate desuccinylase
MTAVAAHVAELAQALIRRPSVTPADAGALDVLQAALEPLGFVCRRLRFDDGGGPAIDNLYARLGTAAPNFCFAGHTDVVPVGDAAAWAADPFAGEIKDGMLWGRGAVDMKGAIAAFVAAVSALTAGGRPLNGSISLLITGDEEGDAVNGTVKVLEWLEREGETLDLCLVGEPTNPTALGDMMKIGRRGSLTGKLTVLGTQGHAAYPHLADNPIPRLARMIAAITDEKLDEGTEHFEASTVAVTMLNCANTASNVIPAEASAAFNIRFNDAHTPQSVEAWLRERFERIGGRYELSIKVSGVSFLTPPGALSQAIAEAVKDVTGREPALSTTGGTSDARFIKNYCPVVEFGLVNQTMHKVDERIALTDLAGLTAIYQGVLTRVLSRPAG